MQTGSSSSPRWACTKATVIALDGSTIRLEKATGKHAGGDFTLAGSLDVTNPRTPVIDCEGSGTHQSQEFQFTTKGPANKPVIATQGTAPFAGTAVPPQPPKNSLAN